MTHYVLGFMFDPSLEYVALIKKNRPAWQEGKINGIGGHIETNEVSSATMSREFEEETGHKTDSADWKYFATMSFTNATVECFTTTGPVRELQSTTDEQVCVYHYKCVNTDIAIPNLTWLIPMARYANNKSGFEAIIYD